MAESKSAGKRCGRCGADMESTVGTKQKRIGG